MRPKRRLASVAAALAVFLFVHACGEGGTEPPPDPPRPTTVTVTPASAELTALGATAQFSAQVLDQYGQVMTGVAVAWASSDASVAGVDASGLATAADNGTATITATAGGVSGSGVVTVEQEVVEVVVAPDADTLVALGDTVRLVAEGTDANGHMVGGVEFTWTSADTAVAEVDGSGLVTAAGNGEAAVTAAADGASASAAVTVEQEVVAVVVAPDSATVVERDTLRMTATAADANSHAVAAVEFTWASGDTLVARVDGSGLVTGVAGGEVAVTATAFGVTGRAELMVSVAVPTTVAVTPDTVRFAALGQTVQLAAEVRDQIGRVMPGAVVSWSSGDTLVAVVDAGGLVTGMRNGTVTITATAGEATGAATAVVMQVAGSVVVSPAEPIVALGDTLRLAAEAFDENGHVVEGAEFTWASSDGAVARVDGSGLVSGVGEGITAVTATTGEASGSVDITVENPDRAALVALYQATDGPDWTNNENWLTDAPLGDWYGVETDDHGRVSRLELRDNGLFGVIPPELGQLGKLQELLLLINNVYGHIPPELGQLSELRWLHLGTNALSGPIPPALGDLAKLEHLQLYQNRLRGTIPPELGDLPELQVLQLQHNNLEGRIPPELGSLESLRSLHLSWNTLQGPIPPELGNLASLNSLYLSQNELTGPIPPELGRIPYLRALDLANNELTGGIPAWLADSDRGSIWLHGNELTGPIPPELGGIASLAALTLSSNQLEGPIPPELGNLSQLTLLWLDANRLSGPIPPELGDLHRLEKLGLSLNRLSGSVPPEFGNLRGLVDLALDGNLLTGALPQTFVQLDNLVTLGCRATRGVCMPGTDAFRQWAQEVEARGSIQGAVDIPWCNEIDVLALERLYEAADGSGWTRSDGWLEDDDLDQWLGIETDSIGRVSSLDLSDNGLSGYMPDAMGLLANMTELRIGRNALSGRLPLALTSVPLQEFDYTDTSLCVADDDDFRQWLGDIPQHTGTGVQCPPLTEREALGWLYRRTDGPRWIESTGWLTEAPLADWYGVETDAAGQVVGLDLGGNRLTGPIPAEISALTALTSLNLRANRLEGAIPGELGELSELRELYLDSNALTGTIPPELGDLVRLEQLNLRRNQLAGSVPPAIGQLANLRIMNLSGNRLSGPIPPQLGDLGRIARLELGWNQLSGSVPPELANLSNLTYLSIVRNFLSGPIPAELGELDRLRHLDLGLNQLSGGIPSELGALGAVAWIGLADNQLTGPIPPQLGTLGRLSGLDLSDNQLTGPIPPELGKLAELRTLQFSDNDLEGSIPAKLGSLANLSMLDLANNRLSGPIPAELGALARLTTLDLGNNELSGPLPGELGGAMRLEGLDLRSNKLSGPIPPGFGNLALVESLIFADNPDLAGPLPSRFTGLERLERFMAGGTGLCRPADALFDSWFRNIADRRLVRCEGGATVYLTQTIQSWDDPVPLLAGEPALLRVFVTVAEGVNATMPEVKATFYVNDAERHTVSIAAGEHSIPREVTQGDLALSANAEVPASVVVPGLEMVIEVDPNGTLDPELGVTKRIPEEGRLAVDVRSVPALQLTLVPFLHESEPDSSLIESVQAMAEDPGSHELLADVRTLLPVTELAAAAHDPVITFLRDPFRLIAQTRAIRLMEGGWGYWMGVMESPPRTGGTNWYYLLPRGVAYLGGWSAVSIRDPGVMAHELGHNLGLQHAPCGGPSQTDPWFPYPLGNTGAWGYDFASQALIAPRVGDIMSYCRKHGYWISDFFFNKALRHRLALGEAPMAQAVNSTSTRTLLLWGGRDKDGVPYLDPAFVVDAVPHLPSTGGQYTIVGATDDETPLFNFNFDMPVFGDAEGDEATFVFALPVNPEWAGDLSSITLSGPNGSVTLDGTTDRPMTILRDPRTGHVRGFLPDLPPVTQTAAHAVGQGAGPGLEVLFSRGLPGAEAWRRQ